MINHKTLHKQIYLLQHPKLSLSIWWINKVACPTHWNIVRGIECHSTQAPIEISATCHKRSDVDRLISLRSLGRLIGKLVLFWGPGAGPKTTNNLPLVDLQLEMGVKVGCLPCLEIPDSKICHMWNVFFFKHHQHSPAIHHSQLSNLKYQKKNITSRCLSPQSACSSKWCHIWSFDFFFSL